MGTLLQDLQFGLRMLIKRPGFSAIAIITLALGIGANTAIFSVANAVLLRPLAYGEPDRLVTVLQDDSNPVAPANFFDWRDQNKVFESMAAAQVWGPNLTGRDQPESLKAMQLTAEMFHVLGVNPLLGRTFAAGDDQTGNDHIVVLSYQLWQRRFGGDKSVIGQQITLDGSSFTVAGVMPASFQFAPFWATNSELWSPLNLTSRPTDRDGESLRVFARLKPGISREQAQTEMETISRRLELQYPDTNTGNKVFVDSLQEKAVGKVRPALLILLAAVGFVLLIGCTNVASLLLAKAVSRRREIAVRTALGATRSRIVRQLLTETMLLSIAGGAAGLLLAQWGIAALVTLGPIGLPREREVGLDSHVLVFTLLLSIVTGILFGLLPSLQTTKLDLSETLKDGGRSATEGGRSERMRRLLVISEVAIAFVLLIGGGLMLKSLLRLRAIDPGFNSNRVLAMSLSFKGSEHSAGAEQNVFCDDVLKRLQALPEVQSASLINHLPLAGDIWKLGFSVEGRLPLPPGQRVGAVYRIIRPDYFRTMGETLVKGRDFTSHDDEHSTAVAVVNQSFARKQWPNEDPIGKRITVSDDGMNPREIVGIVKDTKQREWTAEPLMEMYLPQLQSTPLRSLTLVLKTNTDPLSIVSRIEREIWAVDKNVPVSEVQSMDEVVSASIGQQRFNAILLGTFASLALMLAMVGIYGVMSFSVANRVQEIGIRMALGASQLQVLKLVVVQGMVNAAIGIGIGITASLALIPLMKSLLFGVSTTDFETFGLIACLLSVVALFACLIPARRAARVDPMTALRRE